MERKLASAWAGPGPNPLYACFFRVPHATQNSFNDLSGYIHSGLNARIPVVLVYCEKPAYDVPEKTDQMIELAGNGTQDTDWRRIRRVLRLMLSGPYRQARPGTAAGTI